MKPLAIDAFCHFTFLSDVKFSPTGKNACYVLSRASKKQDCYSSYLYLYNGIKHIQLTSGGKESSFVWLDSETLLFQSNRDKESQDSTSSSYYKIKITGGEATLAFKLPIPTQKVIPLPNGDFIVVGTVFPGFEKMYTGNIKTVESYRQHRKENEDYEIITQNPWWWNGETFTRGAYSSLFYYSSVKRKLTWLTEKGRQISDVKVSSDGQTVYYSSLNIDVPHPAHFGGENIYRMNLSTREAERVCASRPDFVISTYELGKSFLLILAANGSHGMNTDPDFFKLDYHTLSVTPYCTYGESIGSSVCTDIRMSEECHSKMVDDTFYFISTRFDSAHLFKLENGSVTSITQKDGSVDFFDVYEDNILMISLWDMKAQELYDKQCRKISSFNDRTIREKFISKPEYIEVENGDHYVHGFVMKPMGYIPGNKYPVILDIHGGPKCVYSPVLFHEMQYWAGLGYFVIFCNPTGSDGRGAFMDILGKYGTVDYEDIMTFCDAALTAYPEMDSGNLFETGGSYGGFMTNWIIGHTDRFRACASQRSISNWISFYGVSDIGIDFSEDQNATSLWPSAEKMWWHSPMKYADQCHTPTLFLHSFEDYRCPVDQAYQMYSALIGNGVESRLVLFRGENHELSRTGKPSHRIKRLAEITDWFEKHKI